MARGGKRLDPITVVCRLCGNVRQTYARRPGAPFCKGACLKRGRLEDVEWFGRCNFEGCPRAQHNQTGLCNPHYQQQGRGLGLKPLGWREPPIERFTRFVRDDPSGCWLWTGGTTGEGYGAFIVKDGNGKIVERYAHRFSYAHFKGVIPSGMYVDHMCHVHSCVNPGHLQVVTPQENGQNRKGLNPNNTSGYRGVSFNKPRGKYMAYLRLAGRHKTVGFYETAEEANEAVVTARRTHYTNSLEDMK